MNNLFKQIYRFLLKIRGTKRVLGRQQSGLPLKLLLYLAASNMKTKKTRTLVTIGGVALAIGVIVLLLSIGFGLQDLVIDRAVKLAEMRQADVSTQPGSRLRLDQSALLQFKEIANVESALPLIAVVGKINYQDSVTDVAVFAVTADYLENSAVTFVDGGGFASNELERTSLSDSYVREIVVNQALLELISSNNEVVGTDLKIEFTVPSELLNEEQETITTLPFEYRIVGVVNDSAAPIVYVPFIDIRALGVSNYSQIKVTANNPESLLEIRKNIEARGFVTASVADTVAQINSLFATFRILLFAFGLVALAVASLGMFNTLTVSLLERTREIGLMKALGMRSMEVRVLFLFESMLMGISGGILGLLGGFGVGKLADLTLTLFALSKDSGAISISYVPVTFAFFVLILSLVIGFLTGLYPSLRATKISALDALRYE